MKNGHTQSDIRGYTWKQFKLHLAAAARLEQRLAEDLAVVIATVLKVS